MESVSLFSVPLFMFHDVGGAALNRELATRLLAESGHSPGVQRSNIGGWHSRPDLTRRSDQCIRMLLDRMLDCAREAVQSVIVPERGAVASVEMAHAWAMIMRDGDFTALHDHGEADWSAVYYVDADPSPTASGELLLADPRYGVRPIPELGLFTSMVTIQPRSGDLVIFPGWLKHQVCTYQGQRPRVSIAANFLMRAGASQAGDLRSPAAVGAHGGADGEAQHDPETELLEEESDHQSDHHAQRQTRILDASRGPA
jgi:uncharacterized protein (TIGR02466 family)